MLIRFKFRGGFAWHLTMPLLTLLALATNVRCDEASLGMNPVAIGNANIEFFTHLKDVMHGRPPAVVSLTPTDTNGHKFSLYVDLNDMVPEAQTFHFPAFVEEHDTDTWYKFDVVVRPGFGQFDDVTSEVKFTIEKNSRTFTGSTLIPLHSNSQHYLLKTSVGSGDESLGVLLTRENSAVVHIRNLLPNLSINVTKIDTQCECPSCWDKLSSNTPQQFAPGTDATFTIPVTIRPLPALFASLLAGGRKSAADILHVQLTYSPAGGGIERTQTIDIPVRFRPTAWQLGIAVVIGCCLGLSAKFLLSPRGFGKARTLAREVAGGALKAILAELIGVFAVLSDSKIRLLGLDFDPTQFLPALILALLVTGGPTVSGWIQKSLFPRKSSKDLRLSPLS